MIRLYFDSEFHLGDRLMLPESEVHYYASVRRGSGEVRLFNRFGQEALGNLKRNVFEVENIIRVLLPTYRLTVAIALPENAVIPGIIKSVSELGARELIFFAGERSQAARKRLIESPRFQKMAVEAARQCGRGAPLEIHMKKNLESILSDSSNKVWFFDEASVEQNRESQSIRRDTAAALVVIGCEGGWTDQERMLAKKSAEFVHFYTPILRVETAAVAATFYAIERMKSQN